MQTRSGKTYATNNSSSSKKKNNIRINMKLDNVNNRMTLRSQTRTGKTNNSGNTYTASSSSSREKNNIKLEIKVEKVEKVVNRTREPRPTSTPTPRPIPISTNRVPLGFAKPQKISNELAEFLGKPIGTEMPRTYVFRLINGYICNNNLQDPQNGRKIIPDAKLRALLKIGENDELTYFNIKKYMSPHFIKDGNVENAVNCTSKPTPSPISSDRRPSGFVKLLKISNELAEFLGKPIGYEISRIDVSSIINRYIRINNLQDPQNGRKIIPDAKLRSILTIGENDELTYFNFQRYIKHHFIKEN